MILSALFLYPVKSCRGISVQTAEVTRKGFRHDREFLVVDADGTFLTQRTTPALALVVTELGDECVRLQGPKLPPLEVPLRGAGPAKPMTVKVWRDTVAGEDAGDAAAAWFSEYLKQPCRLVRAGDRFRREVPPGKVPDVHRPALKQPVVSFADAFPYLLATEESLNDLNARMQAPIPMDRFRPNVVVRGSVHPYAEDAWQTIRIGLVTFRHGGPCVRCVVTTTDQRTLERRAEPLRTLAGYRRTEAGGVIFAVNFFSEQDEGRVEVGMPVTVQA